MPPITGTISTVASINVQSWTVVLEIMAALYLARSLLNGQVTSLVLCAHAHSVFSKQVSCVVIAN